MANSASIFDGSDRLPLDVRTRIHTSDVKRERDAVSARPRHTSKSGRTQVSDRVRSKTAVGFRPHGGPSDDQDVPRLSACAEVGFRRINLIGSDG
jgi:hypothetical protein